jgi:hypothetical protein
MVKIDILVQRSGSKSNHYAEEKKYINLIFFGGRFRWDNFLIWTVYINDFTED